MILSKKYMAAVATIALTGSLAATPSTATEADTESNNLQLMTDKLTISVGSLLLNEKVHIIYSLHNHALKSQNAALLAHTGPAFAETQDRLNTICTPLLDKIDAGFPEQQRRHPGAFDRPDKSFTNLVNQFRYECTPDVLPSIYLSSAGKIISDVELNRADLHTRRLDVMMRTSKDAEDAQKAAALAPKAREGSELISNERRAQKLSEIYGECVRAGISYGQVIDRSDDLIFIRREAAGFEKLCAYDRQP